MTNLAMTDFLNMNILSELLSRKCCYLGNKPKQEKQEFIVSNK